MKISQFNSLKLGLGIAALAVIFQNCSKVAVQDKVVFMSSLSAFATYEDTPVRLQVTTRQPTLKFLLNGNEEITSLETTNGQIKDFDPKTGKFEYIPDENFHGSDEMMVIAVLEDGRRLENKYPIEVISVNDLPTAKDVFIATKINEKRTVTVADFEAKDADHSQLEIEAIDSNGEVISSIKEGTWGKLEKISLANGQKGFEYTTFSLGATTHRFRIRDGEGADVIVSSTFSPENPIMAFKPALAVRNLNCIFCHATIKGNVISDLTKDAQTKASYHSYDHYGTYGSRAFPSTTFLDGTFYMPRRELASNFVNHAASVLSQAKLTPMGELPNFGKNNEGVPLNGFVLVDANAKVFKDNAPSSVVNVAELFDILFNFRTDAYVEQIRNYPGYKKPTSARAIASLREVVDVKLGHPSEAEINALQRDSNLITYYKQGDDAFELTNFQTHGTYFGNIVGEVMTCDGDLIVNGPVFLKNLKLKTKYGCRIYSSGSVFIEGHKASDTNTTATALNRPGIEYVDVTAQSQLQITSARAVLMGLGKCSFKPDQGTTPEEGMFGRRASYDSATFANIGGVVREDYHKIKATGAESVLLTDAGDCKGKTDRRRSVSFERLLVNAPRVDSRYTGDYKGVVIALNSIWSLGSFSYVYDQVFDQVPILPLIPSEKFFLVKDCESDVNYSLQNKTETLKACVPVVSGTL